MLAQEIERNQNFKRSFAAHWEQEAGNSYIDSGNIYTAPALTIVHVHFTSTSLQLTSSSVHFNSTSLQLTSSSVQLILARLNSKQLPVSLRLLLSFATLEMRTLVWSLGISMKYPLDKGRVGPRLL